MIYSDKKFWIAALERAIKSAGQGAVLGWGAGTFTDISEVMPVLQAVLYSAFGMFMLSIFTSVSSAKLGSNEGPSLMGESLTR
jgi:hypothetical protein